MLVIAKIKKFKVLFFAFSLIIFIVLLLSTIFILNSSQVNKNNSTLSGYPELKQKIINTISENQKDTPLSSRVIKELSKIEDQKTSEKDKYIALASTTSFLANLYRLNNNNKYYQLINNDMNIFAKKNLFKYYNKDDFTAQCMDKSCTDHNQPPQLDNIIKEIKLSDFPQEVKDSLITDLTNTGYRPSSLKKGTVGIYWTLADMTKTNTWFSSSSANLRIADDIYKLIEENYPDEYKVFIKAENEIKK